MRLKWNSLSLLAALAASTEAYADNFSPVGSVTKVSNVTIGSGYTHTEGPWLDGTGGIIFGELNSNHSTGLIWRHDISGAIPNATIAVNGSGGMQGAYTFDATRVVTTDRDTRSVSIRSRSNLNTIQSSVSTFTGGGSLQLNGPNDVAVDSAGGIYFTDPNYENFSNRPGVDGVYYIAPGGTTATRVLTFSANERPNGIVLSPDQQTLYLALQAQNTIVKYPLSTPGSPGSPLTIASVTGPDGIMVDPWGNLIVGRINGISSFSPVGDTLFNFNTGTQVTNVELSGNTLYFTTLSSTTMGLYSLGLQQVPEPGMLAGISLAMLVTLRRRKRSTAGGNS